MKWFLKSKTVLGVILSVLPTLLPLFGVSFSVEDGQLLTASSDSLIQFAGAMLALYGRFKASDVVTITP